ncbi:ATP-binding response regulator [Desulfoferrobacter suflitae]|uniref:ATP-binding response regulator n=1 Tax=Desulfoferrobacter suflitae TaxID=2865782 RepID=UPI0021645992|nr:hybrid sensor histidine kinase/response regulator [Desulfoferrobacter suflitae]MCK8601339.1 response regulator [Desulfoferrobacter suflitae]
MAVTPILIIDDEPGVVEGIKFFLEDEGYDVHEALKAKDGLEIFRSVNPDVVVTDLRMPEMSGIELISEIKKLNAATPIIVITGYGTYDSAVDALKLHVFDFIKKPIDIDVLKTALEKAKAEASQEAEIRREIAQLKEQLELFRGQWHEMLTRFSQFEPLIHTGRSMASILHNLNNPLTSIMTQSELLQIFHPEVRDITTIHQQAVRMMKIVSTVMRKMKECKETIASWLQLNDILKEEMSFLELHPSYKLQIDIKWNLAENLPLFKGIASDFNQIFGNILRNAVEAMEDLPNPKLLISTWYNDTSIIVSIGDTGPGISAHLLERIFQPFFSTKASGRENRGGLGMGIGLYYCRELVRQYGGEIKALSKPGRGTSFVIKLPNHSP